MIRRGESHILECAEKGLQFISDLHGLSNTRLPTSYEIMPSQALSGQSDDHQILPSKGDRFVPVQADHAPAYYFNSTPSDPQILPSNGGPPVPNPSPAYYFNSTSSDPQTLPSNSGSLFTRRAGDALTYYYTGA